MTLDFSTLGQFIGTTEYHKVSLLPYVLTDGAKYVAEEAGAYWLMDEVGAYAMTHRTEGFLHAKLAVEGGHAKLTIDDGNDNVLNSKHIHITDFPEPGIELYCVAGQGAGYRWVIMLKSEY
jgi:hypothetical protein